MQNISRTTLYIDGVNIPYEMYFVNEEVEFVAEGEAAIPQIKFRREQEHWKEQHYLDPVVKEQAIAAIERFLLAQH